VGIDVAEHCFLFNIKYVKHNSYLIYIMTILINLRIKSANEWGNITGKEYQKRHQSEDNKGVGRNRKSKNRRFNGLIKR
jgi:hypothetical protein